MIGIELNIIDALVMVIITFTPLVAILCIFGRR